MEFSEKRERMDSVSNGRSAPLPPVTTRWLDPASRPGGRDAADGTYGKPAPDRVTPPFVPGAPEPLTRVEEEMPMLPAFDSTPVDEAQPESSPEREPATMTPEPLMPWEEQGASWDAPASHEITADAGPSVTAEAESAEPRDLDDWETTIDPNSGQAMPAYGDEESAEDAAFSPPPQLDDEGAVIPQAERADRSFPLDAFIIPPDAKRLPKGLEHAEELHLEIAEALAKRLEDVAQRLRREGFAGLLHHEPGQEPIDTLIAGVLAGYLSNQADA